MALVRLVVLDPAGRRHLRKDGALPSVDLPSGAAIDPRDVARATRDQLGFSAIILRILGRDMLEVQLAGESGTALAGGLTWQEGPSIPDDRRMWWQHAGELTEILNTVDQRLAERRTRRIGEAEQMRYTSVTGLYRIPTDQGPLWLKTNPRLFAHEPAVISWVSGTGRGVVPEVVVAGDRWWLARSFPNAHHEPAGDPLLAMAAVQRASIDRTGELTELGCPERPLLGLPDEIAELTTERHLVTRADGSRLRAVLPYLSRLCAEVAGLGFPPTLVHADLHPDNVRWTADGWLLFDWTDSGIAHPFVELAMPLSYDDAQTARLRARRYAATWRWLASADRIASALRAAPLIGAAHLTVSYARILRDIRYRSGDLPSSDDMVPWFRRWVRALLTAAR